MSTETDAKKAAQASSPHPGIIVSEQIFSFETQTDAIVIPPEQIPKRLPIPKRDIYIDDSTYGGEVFVERDHLLQEALEYPRNGKEPGLVIIFNHEQFENNYQEPRLGSTRDVNEIMLCLGRLGYNIKQEYLFTDLKRDEILKNIEKIASQDMSEYNSLIVFFLSHGDSYNMLYTSDYTIQAHELWRKFAKCGSLANKPKLFFIQACKGECSSKVAGEDHDEIKLVPETTFQPNFLYPDMLVAYSTTEQCVSMRSPLKGTWFIQELCKNFYSYGRRDDILSLLIRTTKCVCRNYYHQKESGEIGKQTPVFISTLSRRFYLNKNRDRNTLLDISQKYKDLEGIVLNLAKKVDEIYKYYEEKERKK